MKSAQSICCQKSIEQYKLNNSQLATSLNQARTHSREVENELARKHYELQQKCVENLKLKNELAGMEAQFISWRTAIAGIVEHNTRGLSQLMGILGMQSTTVATKRDNGKLNLCFFSLMFMFKPDNNTNEESFNLYTDTNAVPTILETAPITTVPIAPQNVEIESVQKKVSTSAARVMERRQSICIGSNNRRNDLTNLIEESNNKISPKRKRLLSVDSSPSGSDTSSTSLSPLRRSARKSSTSTDSSDSPVSPLNDRGKTTPTSPNSITSAKNLALQSTSSSTDNAKKTNARVSKEKPPPQKENEMLNINGRPRRKAAPADLKEDKLNLKMRRK